MSLADVLTIIIYQVLDKTGEARTVALDISESFDSVWHTGLLHKLKVYRISERIFEMIILSHQITK